MARPASFHAIYVVLNDGEFLPASIRSVYDHITGATVITSYDRDRWDRPVRPDSPIDAVLSRELDPDRKINVIASVEVSESRLRNHAMAYALPPRRGRRIVPSERGLTRIPDPDYFWIIDADEVYDETSIHGLKAYIAEHPAQTYFLRPMSYFKSWNWQIEDQGHLLAVMRPHRWFGHLRHRLVTPWVRVMQKLSHEGVLPQDLAFRAFGARIVPRDLVTFHHGNYVGDRARIAAKLASSGHRDETDARWLSDVWDGWTPAARNFHPYLPKSFPAARHISTADLPAAVVEHVWPAGWIERD